MIFVVSVPVLMDAAGGAAAATRGTAAGKIKRQRIYNVEMVPYNIF